MHKEFSGAIIIFRQFYLCYLEIIDNVPPRVTVVPKYIY